MTKKDLQNYIIEKQILPIYFGQSGLLADFLRPHIEAAEDAEFNAGLEQAIRLTRDAINADTSLRTLIYKLTDGGEAMSELKAGLPKLTQEGCYFQFQAGDGNKGNECLVLMDIPRISCYVIRKEDFLAFALALIAETDIKELAAKYNDPKCGMITAIEIYTYRLYHALQAKEAGDGNSTEATQGK